MHSQKIVPKCWPTDPQLHHCIVVNMTWILMSYGIDCFDPKL
jgi:hypothetical protein